MYNNDHELPTNENQCRNNALCKGQCIERRPLSPDRGTGHRHEAEVSCFTMKGLIFDNGQRRSIHYPAYYTATCQNENITSHGVSFFNLFVTSILSVDQQRNNLFAKTVTSLSNGRRWA